MNIRILEATVTFRCKCIPIIVFFILSISAFAESPNYWISLAENALIVEDSYTVDRTSEVYEKQIQKKGAEATSKFIKKTSSHLRYTKKKGLKPLPKKEATGNSTRTSQKSFFTLDIAHMLQKMKGKVQWVLEDENAFFNDEDCVITSSSGDKWLVRLWIRKTDGVVLRYDQYLNEQLTGRSIINYNIPRKGKYFPKKSTTEFKTGQKFIQYYENYSFTEN